MLHPQATGHKRQQEQEQSCLRTFHAIYQRYDSVRLCVCSFLFILSIYLFTKKRIPTYCFGGRHISLFVSRIVGVGLNTIMSERNLDGCDFAGMVCLLVFFCSAGGLSSHIVSFLFFFFLSSFLMFPPLCCWVVDCCSTAYFLVSTIILEVGL